jgi:hypothetical protein
MLALLLVNHMDDGPLGTEFIGNTSAYAIGSTRHNHYFILVHTFHILLF